MAAETNVDLPVKIPPKPSNLTKSLRQKFSQIFFTRWKIWQDARFLLFCLCIAGIVQGMIFTNVVISSIERRFGYDSTQSGLIAGCYDLGSLIAVIPVTYFGGRPGASKPKVIAIGMVVIASGSLIFSLPHFATSRYVDLIAVPTDETNSTSSFTSYTSRNETDEFLFNRVCKLEAVEKVTSDDISNCDKTNQENLLSTELHNYKYVFILGQLLHGIGGSAITTLGTTLLDESVTRRSSPLYIGIFETSFVLGPAIGYVVGGKLLSIFTEFYVTDEAGLSVMDSLTPTSPQWVGAWWLGFLLIVILALACGSVLWFFPTNMPIPEETTAEPETDKNKDNNDDNNNNEFMVNRCDYGRLKDLPAAVMNLVKNKIYVCISIGAALDAFLLAGKAAFLPKYLENQFGLTSSQAAMLVGAIIVPAGAGGTLLGGYLLKRFNMDRKKCLQFYIACQVIILPLYLGFLFNCPTLPFGGVNVSPGDDGLQLEASCNKACQCNVFPTSMDPSSVSSPFYEPVCHISSGMTYFSACLAGCTASTALGQNNQTVFHNCACLQTNGQLLSETNSTDGDDYVIPGACPSECNHIYFSIVLFINILFTFVATMPGLVASLRSVEPVQRSLSLGLQMMLLRGIGTVPGPVVFGFVIDQSCLLWQTTIGQNRECSGANMTKGSCRLYDNVPMSWNVMAVVLSWRFVGAIFFVLALFFSNREANQVKNDKSNSTSVEEGTKKKEAH